MFFVYFSFCYSNYEIINKYNAKWLKIFYHNSSSQIFFKNSEEALNCNTFHKYSILNEINNNFLINNKFEFLLEYPELNGYNRWVQNTNPINQTDSIIPGYNGIHIDWSGVSWGGLARSSSIHTLLDGSTNSWYFAIGAFTYQPTPDKFPGPVIGTNYLFVSYCYLYIRIDGTKFQFQSNSQNFSFSQLIFPIIFFFHFLMINSIFF